MIIFVVALAVIILLTLRITTGFGAIRKNASTKEQQRTAEPFLSHHYTTIINGIFVLLIFFSHSTGYLTLSDNMLDSLYRHFQNFHNQWVVTTFLAFSGFGVTLKIMRGGGTLLTKK